MDKKGIIGIICAVLGLVAWQVYTAKQTTAYNQYMEAQAAEEKAKKAEEAAKVAANPPPLPVEGATAGVAVVPATPAVEEKVETLKTDVAQYAFTNLGGGIARATLNKHLVDKQTQKVVVLNEFGKIPIGAVSFKAGEETSLPFSAATDPTSSAITFERVDEKQLALTKKFSLPKSSFGDRKEQLREEYLLTLDVTFTNRGQQALSVPTYWVHTGSTAPLHENDAPLYIGLNYFRDGGNKLVNVTWFQSGGFPFYRGARPVFPDGSEQLDDLRWVAAANQYFTSLIIPVVDQKQLSDEQKKQRGVNAWARHFTVPFDQWAKTGRLARNGRNLDAMDGAIAVAGFDLAPGQSVTKQFQLLVGPSEYGRLREFNNYETEILDFGWFGIISKGLLNSLNWFQSILGSYWAAIMVLTVIIRAAMWPLQNRATETAKKMQALSPKLKDIQERYKDDPMRLQQETGKLWKEHGVNPVGGCLPMLVQIPIFFGFYNMLNRAVELRNNGFLWVQDLSQPDTVGHIGSIPINILPLVMAGTMVVQMKLTPKAGDPMQQKIMMFMPLIFVALCYNYAAALALYWSVQNLFSIVQLFVTRNQNPVTVIPPTPLKKAKR